MIKVTAINVVSRAGDKAESEIKSGQQELGTNGDLTSNLVNLT
jgi:hypothetical protein